MSSPSSVKAAGNQCSHTEVRTERIFHDWTIKKFHLLPEDVDEKICSPSFYSQDRSEKWNFQFYPRGSASEDTNYVALFLARDSPGKSPITVDVELKISKSNAILKTISFTAKYGPSPRWGHYKFLERSKLHTRNSSDDDQFTISCMIDTPVEVITSSFDAQIFDLNQSQLSDNLRLLFEDPIFSDFTIIVGDQKFPTHRNILARRSPVFAAMFEHKELEENRKKEVKIEHIEPDVIRGMLEFIYTDQVTSLNELASGLLEAANKYELEKLRIMCEKTLYEGLTKDNAVEVLQIADLHRADTLKKCAMKYIVAYAPELMKSDDWKKTGCNLELLLELFDQLILLHAADNSQAPKA